MDRKRQKMGKASSGIKLVGYRPTGEFSTSPPIPEEGEMGYMGLRQSSSLNFMSSNPVGAISHHSRQGDSKETISSSSSFEFRSGFSPPIHTRVSPTRGVIEFGTPTSGGPVSREPQVMKKRVAATTSVPVTSSLQRGEEDQAVYRPNLEETHLSDVAVFGRHFDPSQLTQERMESNVGNLSSVGLNQPSPLVKKRDERAREREQRASEREILTGTEFSSGSLRLERGKTGGLRSKSESVSPNRKIKGREEEKLASWEMTGGAHTSHYASVLATPSRHRMGRVSKTFREPVPEDNDVFGDDITKGSMPDVFRPVSSVSPSHRKSRGVKEETPESGTSDEEKPKKKRSIGYSLGRKLSSSMRELFSKEKRNNPTSGTTWHFEVSADLYPAPSEPQLSVLTESERREIVESTEVVPRARSTEGMLSGQPSHQTSTPAATSSVSGGNPLAHLFIPPAGMSIEKGVDTKQATPSGFYEERAIDVEGTRSPLKSVASDDTASDSEEGYVKSAVNIISPQPPEDDAIQFISGERRVVSPPQTGLSSSPTGLPTIKEQSLPRPRTDTVISYEMPQMESAPIVKKLEGIVDTKSGSKGKGTKTSSQSEREGAARGKKDDASKEKKSLFRFTKSRTVVERRAPSPKPGSPASVPGSASGSPRSSGRISPSHRPGAKSSTNSATNDKNAGSAKRGTKTASGNTKTGSPGSSFRGTQISPLSPGGRGSPSGRGSPRSSLRGGANSPLRSSIRSTASATVASSGGRNSGRGSPIVGASRSPRGSIQGGSPRGSGRGSKNSPPSTSPGVKTPSPRASTQLRVSQKQSPVATRKNPPSASANAAVKGKRRLSEPVVSPLSGTSPFARSPSARSNISIGSNGPRPVRKAPPPPIKATPTHQPLSRTSSQVSTGGDNSSSSSTASPRQRKKGMSLSHSPLTPKRLSTAQLENDATVAKGSDNVFKATGEADDTEKLMSSIREKLAALSENSQPDEDPNPLDRQTQFEVPPPLAETTPTATPLSPTGSDAKIPTYKLTPSGELKIEGEDDEAMKKDDENAEGEEFTAVATPDSGRRGLRPKTVISNLIGGRGKKKSTADTTTTKNSSATGGGSFRKGKGGIDEGKEAKKKASTSSPLVGKKQTGVSSGKPPQKGGLSTGLPPRGPSLRGARSGGDGGGRSQSSIVVPTIQVTDTRKSTRKVSSHAAVGMATSGGLRSSRGSHLGSQSSLARSSIRVSSKLKRNNPMSPEHRKVSSLTRPKPGDRPPSRGSMHSLPRNSTTARVSVRRPVRVAPVAPGRASTRKPSTATPSVTAAAAGNDTKKLSVAGGNLDTRRTSTVSKSLRKTSATSRSQGDDSLNRNVAMRSMRLPSSRRVSALGTMPRSSVVTKLGVSGGSSVATGNQNTTASVARKSMRKVSSNTKEVYDVFDEISADAKGKL